MIFTYLLALLPLVNTSSSFQIQSDSNSISPQKKVNVKLGVMSRCPDATFTESLFDQIIDVEPVIDLITLELIYIGTINNDGTIESKHGEGEAQTDIKQLCAGKHWQNPSIRAPWLDTWNFVSCLNWKSPVNEIGNDDDCHTCAKLVGRDWNDPKIQHCINSNEGKHLLKHSVLQSQKLNVTKSATVLMENNLVCVHDSTWKECTIGHEVADFVKEIKRISTKLNE